MFCAIGSDAAFAMFAATLAVLFVASFAGLVALFVASLTTGAEAPGIAAAAEGGSAGEPDVARSGALPLAAESGAERVVGFVVEAVLAGDPSSAPQPLNAIVAKNSVALAMRVAFVMSASGLVKAGAVSNRFEK
jgi:hypothetical protein